MRSPTPTDRARRADGLDIRLAGAADWPRIWPIWQAVVAAGDTFAYDPDTTSDDARTSWLAPAPAQTWLAADGDNVVGIYHLGPNHAGPGAHIANASYMVDPARHGRGIGRVLVAHSVNRARESGYLGITFNAVAATNVYAIKLYHDLGFTTIGTVPQGFRHPTEGLVDLLIMHRPV